MAERGSRNAGVHAADSTPGQEAMSEAGSGGMAREATPFRPVYLHLVAFAVGAAVMALELLGTRMLAPVCGTSIYVWAAVITVTLASLAVGYAHGGRAADEAKDVRPLGQILLAAGLGLAVLAAVSPHVLRLLSPLDLRLAALLGSFLLFAFPLACLGAAMPMCVGLATPQVERVGRAVGSIYLASTIGSCVSTLVSGYLLIPYVGVAASLAWVACCLIGLGIAGSVRSPALGIGMALLTVLLGTTAPVLIPVAKLGEEVRRVPLCRDMRKQLGLAVQMYWEDYDRFQSPPFPQSAGPPFPVRGQRAHRVVCQDSLAGRIEVWVSPSQKLMLVDGMLQTAMPLDERKITERHHLFPEMYWLELLPYFRPGARKALLVGLGGGLLPRVLSSYGITTHAVELDAKIVEIAQEHFAYDGPVTIADGRRFLRQTRDRYDFVMLDAFVGDSLPSHLLTREAFREAKAILTPNGILAINVIEIPQSGKVLGAIGRTAREVFPQCVAYHTDTPGHAQMVTLFASDAPMWLQYPPRGPRRKAGSRELRWVRTFEVPVRTRDGAMVLDDRNPFDVLYAPVALEWRRLNADVVRG